MNILYTHIFRCNSYACGWLGTQQIRLKQTPWDATDTFSLITGRNSCLGLTTRDATHTRDADTLGHNWYNSSLTAKRNSSCLGLTTRDATDTREADTLGRNWYNFLTAGRNSYFPHSLFKARLSASSSNVQHLPVSLRSSGSCLSLIPRLLLPSIFTSITRSSRQFLRKMWPIHSAYIEPEIPTLNFGRGTSCYDTLWISSFTLVNDVCVFFFLRFYGCDYEYYYFGMWRRVVW